MRCGGRKGRERAMKEGRKETQSSRWERTDLSFLMREEADNIKERNKLMPLKEWVRAHLDYGIMMKMDVFKVWPPDQ